MGYYSEGEDSDVTVDLIKDKVNVINENDIAKQIIDEIYPNSIIENIRFIGKGNSGSAYIFTVNHENKIVKIYNNPIGYEYPKLTQSKYYDIPEIHKCRLTTCAIMPYDEIYISLDKWDFSMANHNDGMIWKIIFNLIHGMYELHKNNTFHRDITCSNILIHKLSYDVKFIDMDTSCVGDNDNNDCNDDIDIRYYQNDYYAVNAKYVMQNNQNPGNIVSSDIDWHAIGIVILDILGHNTNHDQSIKNIIKEISKNNGDDLDNKIHEYISMVFRNCENHKEIFLKFYNIILKPCLDVKINSKLNIIEKNINEFDLLYHDKLEKPTRCIIIRNRNMTRTRINNDLNQNGGMKKIYIMNKMSYLYL